MVTIEIFKKMVYGLPINLKGFCEKTGLNYNSMALKLHNDKQLDIDESKLIEQHLRMNNTFIIDYN